MRRLIIVSTLSALVLTGRPTAAIAQEDHSQHVPAPQAPIPATQPPPRPGEATPPAQPAVPAQRQQPASTAQAPGTGGDRSVPAGAPSPADIRQQTEEERFLSGADAPQEPKEPISPLTNADREAAFPSGLGGHAVHDRAINYMVLFDQLEWQGGSDGGPGWDNTTWIGGDLNRLWLRSEGESHAREVESAFVDALWGRRISRWWDLVAGVRQDFRPGPGRTWVGGGIQGLAPMFFEVEATAFVGPGGRTLARLEADYSLLVTNRLILQPLVEAELLGKADPERQRGAGLTSFETGLRLRYEFRREFAPFVGVTWNRSLFGTADFARAAGEDVGSTRIAVGLRTWF